jgi:hypothetical protein
MNAGGRPSLAGSVAVVGLAVTLLLTAGCKGNDAASLEQPDARPSATTSTETAPTSAATQSAVDGVLAQYRGFWSVVVPVADAPRDRRKKMLEPYSVDPALSRILRGVVAAETYGRSSYGEYVLRPDPPTIKGATATVRDCQDSSGVGLRDRKTGKRLTRGRSHDPVVTTLRRGADGVWRVATVEYLDGSCPA